MRHQIRQECIAWLRTLASAAMYATLLITFVGQVARAQGTSMEVRWWPIGHARVF